MTQSRIDRTVGAGLAMLVAGAILNWVLEGWELGRWWDLLLPTVAFWLILTGALLLWAATRRPPAESGLGPRLESAQAISIPLTCGYLLSSLLIQFGSTGAGSLGNCQRLTDVVTSSASVPESKSWPGHPAVFCMTDRYGVLLTRYTDLLVYGVEDRKAQDRILWNLTRFHLEASTEPLRVIFLDKEVYATRTGKNGVQVGTRGPERVLRTATVR